MMQTLGMAVLVVALLHSSLLHPGVAVVTADSRGGGAPPPYYQQSEGVGEGGIDVLQAAAGAVQDVRPTAKELAGAAVVAGVAGMLVAGPALGVIGAIGGAVVAATDKGDVGGVARAAGRAATDTFDKARAFDREYKVTEKVKEVAANALNKAKQLDAEHHILQRAKEDTITVLKTAKDWVVVFCAYVMQLNEKHKIVDKVGQGIIKGLDMINKVLTDDGGKGGDGDDGSGDGRRRSGDGEGKERKGSSSSFTSTL